jgi:hypothetical protein
VADAKVPRRSDPTSIVLGQKVERVTADSKAMFFKAAELKRTGQNEGDSGEPGSMLGQPGAGIDEPMQPIRSSKGREYCKNRPREAGLPVGISWRWLA